MERDIHLVHDSEFILHEHSESCTFMHITHPCTLIKYNAKRPCAQINAHPWIRLLNIKLNEYDSMWQSHSMSHSICHVTLHVNDVACFMHTHAHPDSGNVARFLLGLTNCDFYLRTKHHVLGVVRPRITQIHKLKFNCTSPRCATQGFCTSHVARPDAARRKNKQHIITLT